MRSLLLLVLLSGALPAYAAEGPNPACTKQVSDAFAKLKGSKAFRVQTTITNETGTLNMRADYVLPDRMHQTVMLGKEGAQMELVVIGKKAWSNQGAGWAELPEAFAQTVARQLEDSITAGTGAGIEYKCLGDKALEGKQLSAYEGALPMPLTDGSSKPGPRVSALSVPKIQTLYIDKTTGLPVRNIVHAATEPDKRLFDGNFVIDDSLSIETPSTAAAGRGAQ